MGPDLWTQQKMHFPDNAQNICMLPVKGEQIHPACQPVNRLQKSCNHLPSCVGLKKTTWKMKALNLIKKDVFYILLFHNTSCSSGKLAIICTSLLLLLVVAHMTMRSTDLMDRFCMLSRDWLQLWMLMHSCDVRRHLYFYILAILFHLKSGIQIVKRKASFTAFNKIWARDYTLQIVSWKWCMAACADIRSVGSNPAVWM